MLTTLAFRHLLVKRLRSLFLLIGFGLGVGVMIVLLSVGQAMLDQSRDVSLVGGGEITVLPEGIDIEAMRTGGLSGMFFGIDRARFVVRELIGGARHGNLVQAVSPLLEEELVYLRKGSTVVAARAGGEIPSRRALVGAPLDLIAGRWQDTRADSAYASPSSQQLYDDLDRFHLPSVRDTTWAEWHYFNVVVSEREWWYLTYMVGGDMLGGRWGGRLLVSHRRPAGDYDRFTRDLEAAAVSFDTARADLTLGESSVVQRDGAYRLRMRIPRAGGDLRVDATVVPVPRRYFPPVELGEEALPSGYVVAGLRAQASGSICVGARCTRLDNQPAYHDHNWGVWRDVTWDWGAATGRTYDLLYGAIYSDQTRPAGAPTGGMSLFVTLVDSLGVRQIFRATGVAQAGSLDVPGVPGLAAPRQLGFMASRDADTLEVRVQVTDVAATRVAAGPPRYFLQMRGRFSLTGQVGAQPVDDAGTGFFETYRDARSLPRTAPPR